MVLSFAKIVAGSKNEKVEFRRSKTFVWCIEVDLRLYKIHLLNTNDHR